MKENYVFEAHEVITFEKQVLFHFVLHGKGTAKNLFLQYMGVRNKVISQNVSCLDSKTITLPN